MAMTAQAQSGDLMSEMNTTPLIDVMLVLLVLLIITLPLQTHAIIVTDPHRAPWDRPPTPVVLLSVDFDGTPMWNGWRVDKASLDARLEAAAHQDPQPEIHLSANRLTRYDAVAGVLAATQRHGLTNVAFLDTEKY